MTGNYIPYGYIVNGYTALAGAAERARVEPASEITGKTALATETQRAQRKARARRSRAEDPGRQSRANHRYGVSNDWRPGSSRPLRGRSRSFSVISVPLWQSCLLGDLCGE